MRADRDSAGIKIPLGDHIDLVFPILYPSTVAARTGGCLEQYARSVNLVPCTEQYWEFVRALRMDERVAEGFIEKADITPGQQKLYMAVHSKNYFIATIDNVPAGFVGIVDGEIRVCTHPDFQRRGVASFMLRELMRRFPDAVGKVKVENEASKKLFEANGFRPRYTIYEPAG